MPSICRSFVCANFTQIDQILSSLLRLVPYGTLGWERVKNNECKNSCILAFAY